MSEPAVRDGLSLAASDFTMNIEDCQQMSAEGTQGDKVFETSREPATALQSPETANLGVQLRPLLQSMILPIKLGEQAERRNIQGRGGKTRLLGGRKKRGGSGQRPWGIAWMQ